MTSNKYFISHFFEVIISIDIYHLLYTFEIYVKYNLKIHVLHLYTVLSFMTFSNFQSFFLVFMKHVILSEIINKEQFINFKRFILF